MKKNVIQRMLSIHSQSTSTEQDYWNFLQQAHKLLLECGQYFCDSEDINCLELAHLIPAVPATMLAAYVGINDAVCNKGLVTPLLPQHGHNNVFVFDNEVYGGNQDVPAGTADAKAILPGFQPPNETWPDEWTYVMIEDPQRDYESLWREKGYIDMIPGKFEDFTMLTDTSLSRVCAFVSPKAFEHPVNKSRQYLQAARERGEKMAGEFQMPKLIKDEFTGLEPVILNQGEKLYVATTDFGPCAHGWCNIHPDNQQYAVVNENSAVPLDLVIAKPPVAEKYACGLIPAKGSADLTTDWFKRTELMSRAPLLHGLFKG